jgi:hypothetical protein
VLPDYDKCLRDMVSINAHAAGVVFPTNKTQFEKRSMIHYISKYNATDNFYTIPVCVPFVEDGQEYSDWKTGLDDSMKMTEECIGQIIEYEKDFCEKIHSQKEAIEKARMESEKINPLFLC